jgi:sugar phosphate isomerase/epimerase
MLSRRAFLQTIAATTGGILLTNPTWAELASPKKKLANVGFITGIVGKELKQDWKGTLKKAADYGFTEIETGNYLGNSASEFIAYCKQVGIKNIGGGIPISLEGDALQKRLNELNELKAKYAVVYWPWKVSAPFKLENCQKSVELLNTLGEACKKQGLTLCWHNHDKEFTPMEEGLPFDYLMQHTDPNLVKCEMDIYWVAKGSANPLDMLKKYKGRYEILHVKDMAKDGSQTFECPGSGIIDFPSIFAEAQSQGIKHYIVERDQVVDGLACLQSSGQYLRELRF